MNGLRTGYTTGTCAACAAGVAVRSLLGENDISVGAVTLPDGERITLPIAHLERSDGYASVGIRKDAGDDPDDTNGVIVFVKVSWQEGAGISFFAGSGVGTVTKPGLSVPVGEAAINPVPRRMIVRAIREVTQSGVRVYVSIPGGADIAKKTFNPRLGIQGGLSILGTSGRVVPFSCPAIRESLRYLIRVAAASGVKYPLLVPGKIGARAAEQHFCFEPGALVSVGNEWGVVLDETANHEFTGVLALGHPGKLTKLIDGHFQTHSKNSPSALPIVHRESAALGISVSSESPTVEGVFTSLSPEQRALLANRLADSIKNAIRLRTHQRFAVAVVLINMNVDLLGVAGDFSSWSGS